MPDYAPAHTGLASARFLEYEATRASNTPKRDLLKQALVHARRGCELDPTLGEAWATLGFVLTAAGQVEEARAVARQQVESCELLNRISAGLSEPLPGMPANCSLLRFTDADERNLLRQNDAFPFSFTSQPEPEMRASAMNALAHGADSLYTPLAAPVSRRAALRGVRRGGLGFRGRRDGHGRDGAGGVGGCGARFGIVVVGGGGDLGAGGSEGERQ